MSHLFQSRKNVRLIFHATTATVLPFPNLDGHNSTPDTILTTAAPQKSLLLPFLTSQSSLKCKLAIAGKPPHVYSSKPGSSVTLICLPVFPFGLLKKKISDFEAGLQYRLKHWVSHKQLTISASSRAVLDFWGGGHPN